MLSINELRESMGGGYSPQKEKLTALVLKFEAAARKNDGLPCWCGRYPHYDFCDKFRHGYMLLVDLIAGKYIEN